MIYLWADNCFLLINIRIFIVDFQRNTMQKTENTFIASPEGANDPKVATEDDAD